MYNTVEEVTKHQRDRVHIGGHYDPLGPLKRGDPRSREIVYSLAETLAAGGAAAEEAAVDAELSTHPTSDDELDRAAPEPRSERRSRALAIRAARGGRGRGRGRAGALAARALPFAATATARTETPAAATATFSTPTPATAASASALTSASSSQARARSAAEKKDKFLQNLPPDIDVTFDEQGVAVSFVCKRAGCAQKNKQIALAQNKKSNLNRHVQTCAGRRADRARASNTPSVIDLLVTQAAYEKNLVDAVVESGVALNAFEGPAFRKFLVRLASVWRRFDSVLCLLLLTSVSCRTSRPLQATGRNAKLSTPSRRTITRRLLATFDERQVALARRVMRGTGPLAMTADLWTCVLPFCFSSSLLLTCIACRAAGRVMSKGICR